MGRYSKLQALVSGKKLFVDITPGPAADSPTVIFLHGLGSATTFYEASLYLSKLSSKYQLIRYDHEGHGLSPLSSTGASAVSIDSLVQDLGQLLDSLEIERVRAIVAHSMSGLISTTFAVRYPKRVEQLILLGPIRAMAPAGQELMRGRASTVLSSGVSAIVGGVVSSATSKATQANAPLALALIRALVLGTQPDGYAAACRAIADASDPDYAKVEAGVLVIGGEEDYLSSPALIASLVGAIGPEASSVELKGVGHWVAVESPDKIAELMDKTLL